ncbi:hypothetical protein [Streptomyces sp. NPDC093105]|uniref:hypothetical protein n=1 Tax=Streptomyces sp. NPDC093105 TaxID=3366029 RepID=UPI0037F58BB2
MTGRWKAVRRGPSRAARALALLGLVAATVLGPSGTASGAPTAAAAAPPPYLALKASYGAGTVTDGWAAVERYRDTTSGFRAEGYPADGRGDQDGKRVTYVRRHGAASAQVAAWLS